MNSSAIKRFLAAIVCASVSCFNGCGVRSVGYVYSNAESYKAFDGADLGSFTAVDIGWVNGKITVKSGAEFSVTESGADFSRQELRLRYFADGDTLRLRFAESGTQNLENVNKALVITIPDVLNSLSVNSVAADVELDGVIVKKMNVNIVSGGVSVVSAAVDSLDVDVVSGDTVIDGSDIGKLGINSVSGAFSLSLPKCNLKSDIVFHTVSGDATLTVGENVGVTVKQNTVSGGFACKQEYKTENKKYIIGDGDGIFLDVDSVSGSVVIKVLKQ